MSSSQHKKHHRTTEAESLSSVAGGAFFTLFLAKPSDKLSELPRYPEHIDSASVCLACNKVQGDANSLLECEKVRWDRLQKLTLPSATNRTTLDASIHL